MRRIETQNEEVDLGAIHRVADGLRGEKSKVAFLKLRNGLASTTIDESKPGDVIKTTSDKYYTIFHTEQNGHPDYSNTHSIGNKSDGWTGKYTAKIDRELQVIPVGKNGLERHNAKVINQSKLYDFFEMTDPAVGILVASQNILEDEEFNQNVDKARGHRERREANELLDTEVHKKMDVPKRRGLFARLFGK
jgi:hypothetical protein